MGFLLWGLGWGLCRAFAVVTFFAGLFPVALPAAALSVGGPFVFCSMRTKNMGLPWWCGALFYGGFCVLALVHELSMFQHAAASQVYSVVFSLLATSLATLFLTAPEGFASSKKYDTAGKVAAALLSIVLVPWSFMGVSSGPPLKPGAVTTESRDHPGSVFAGD